MNLLSVREAQEHILQKVHHVGQTNVPLDQAARRVLAQDIHAANDLSPFDNSSMDGFAVRAADTSATRVTLRVVADIAAGASLAGSLAPLPAGADAVIPISGNLLSLVQANALLIIPAGVKSRPAGQKVEAWLI